MGSAGSTVFGAWFTAGIKVWDIPASAVAAAFILAIQNICHSAKLRCTNV